MDLRTIYQQVIENTFDQGEFKGFYRDTNSQTVEMEIENLLNSLKAAIAGEEVKKAAAISAKEVAVKSKDRYAAKIDFESARDNISALQKEIEKISILRGDTRKDFVVRLVLFNIRTGNEKRWEEIKRTPGGEGERGDWGSF